MAAPQPTNKFSKGPIAGAEYTVQRLLLGPSVALHKVALCVAVEFPIIAANDGLTVL